jgi:phosphoenolpyruvate carboxykinase (ATP)
MSPETRIKSHVSGELHLRNVGRVYWNLTTPALYEQIVRRREGEIVHLGPVSVRTGHHTGRAAQDKFIVKDEESTDKVWWGKVNPPFEPQRFEALYRRITAYLQGRDLFVQDVFAGADPQYRVAVRVVTESAWHNLFARTMFTRASREDLENFQPDFTILHVPNFQAFPEVDGTNSETFIILNLSKKLVVIGGTSYAGEIKKSIFTVLNYLLPQEKVLSMHCSANQGAGGDVALFFGLSGTGKTTLSADPDRRLIGDDEHGWSDRGVFNFEGGCYAKVIRLSAEAEPEIYECTRRFGTILENVMYDPTTRRLDLDDDSLTENTRAAYPVTHIPNIVRSGMAGLPNNIIMLTADAFGVLPPVAKLTPAQTMYHFISGYTAKLGGTEKGLGKEPQATFSACFGAPFMALHPFTYASLLNEKISSGKVDCWLVNTGWSGGPYGVGKRMKIAYTRAIVKAVLSGQLKDVPVTPHPIFKIGVPETCPGVPKEILDPRSTWSDQSAYDKEVFMLARKFAENFAQYEVEVSEEVRQAAPNTKPE